MTDQNSQSEWTRPVGRNSVVWEHFEENSKDRKNKADKIRVRCLHCPALFTYSGSTTNQWRHMRVQHPQIKLGGQNEESEKPTSSGSKSISAMANFLFKMDTKETRAKVIYQAKKSFLTRQIEIIIEIDVANTTFTTPI